MTYITGGEDLLTQIKTQGYVYHFVLFYWVYTPSKFIVPLVRNVLVLFCFFFVDIF